MPETGTSGSVGALGRQRPRATWYQNLAPDQRFSNDASDAAFQSARTHLHITAEAPQKVQLTSINAPSGATTNSAPKPLDPAGTLPASPPPANVETAPKPVVINYTGVPAASAVTGSSVPVTLLYEEGQPIPAGYHVVSRSRRGLVIAGAIVWSVSYAVGVGAAQGNDYKYNTSWMVLPVLGPWLGMATYSCSAGDQDCRDVQSGARTAFAIVGVGQAVGAGLFALGVAKTNKSLVRSDLVGNVVLAPMRLGRAGQGLGIQGTF